MNKSTEGLKNTKRRVPHFLVFLFLGFSVLLFFRALSAHAQLSRDLQDDIRGLGQQAAMAGLGENAASDIDVRVYALRLVRSALGFVGIALIALMLYGGFLYMTSQGNEEKLGVAKKVLTQAAIGTAIIISSYGVTVFITRQLVKAIYTQMITQAQSCGTTGGQSTCCQEWSAYQTALGAIPTLTQGADAIADQNSEQAEHRRQTYDNWHDCFERETNRAGLDSNLFD